MKLFDFNPTIRVIYGAGTLVQLGALIEELGGKRILVVTDPGIVNAGIVDRAVTPLRDASLDVFVFDDTSENPTTEHVDVGVAFAKAKGDIDLIVGLGGGSAMDTAKGINFVLTNGGQMVDYRGMGHAEKPMLPSIGIPTTAGTGSEAQSFALIAQADTHEKMACGDLKARFRSVILDPELTESVPKSVVAATGIDAISHALESYVSTKRNAVSCLFALEAWRLLSLSFERVLKDPSDTQARGQMLVGANFAGSAIENAMLGAAHACANPLTANYGIAHGEAVGLMLPEVIRFNGETEGELYEGLGVDALTLAGRVVALKDVASLPTRLRDLGVNEEKLPQLAKEAATQWTGTFNPRTVREEDFLVLYKAAF
ncbi:MAG: iron-containing alcohol dehydrogenase [Candidatus Latescibacteria bacterium]|nr:iron-containing alcohol dehydrogenase [Candidatus Latescibacterota bacterium]